MYAGRRKGKGSMYAGKRKGGMYAGRRRKASGMYAGGSESAGRRGRGIGNILKGILPPFIGGMFGLGRRHRRIPL